MEVKFSSKETRLTANFGNVCNITDGGFERGYEQGYTKGQTEGYNKGKTDGYSQGYEAGNAEGYANGYQQGLDKRQFETWTITLTDGSVIEKEVALL